MKKMAKQTFWTGELGIEVVVAIICKMVAGNFKV